MNYQHCSLNLGPKFAKFLYQSIKIKYIELSLGTLIWLRSNLPEGIQESH